MYGYPFAASYSLVLELVGKNPILGFTSNLTVEKTRTGK